MAQNVLRLGNFDDNDITEASGLVASRRYANVFWTHNDQGNSSRLFATTRAGKKLGTYRLKQHKLSDWEDIAVDDSGNLYLADIGNGNEDRKVLVIYRVLEPNPYQSGQITAQRSWRVRFPRGSYDAEAFITAYNNGYIITKDRANDRALMFRFPLNGRSTLTMTQAGAIAVNSNITGADLSRDKKRLALISDEGAYLFVINGNLSAASRVRPVFTSFNHEQMEGAAFAGNGLLTCSESGDLFLFNRPAFRVR